MWAFVFALDDMCVYTIVFGLGKTNFDWHYDFYFSFLLDKKWIRCCGHDFNKYAGFSTKEFRKVYYYVQMNHNLQEPVALVI